MRALVFKRYGGLDQVVFADLPRPVPKPDEILVQVHAAGLNPVENKIRSGKMKAILRFQLPATLGSDLAGVVVEVGGSVTRFKPGDAVFASIDGLRMGALAELAVVTENAAALKPAHLDFVQAASIPMVGLTAWQTLKERAHIKPGHKVFIPAGAGGIGTFAIQLAKYLGAKVATTTSAGNVDLVRSLGADEVIDYQKQNFEVLASDIDLIVDLVGGQVLDKSWSVLSPSGVLASIAATDVVSRAPAGRHGIWLSVKPDTARLATIAQEIADGSLRSTISEVVGFDDLASAIERNRTGHAPGKIVLDLTR